MEVEAIWTRDRINLANGRIVQRSETNNTLKPPVSPIVLSSVNGGFLLETSSARVVTPLGLGQGSWNLHALRKPGHQHFADRLHQTRISWYDFACFTLSLQLFPSGHMLAASHGMSLIIGRSTLNGGFRFVNHNMAGVSCKEL